MKRITAALLSSVMLFSSAVMLSSVSAAENGNVPSIIVNDEKWYKDAVSPLIMRDGKTYVPAQVFTMLDGITVTEVSENGLLIANAETKEYVSILFSERAAAVNGEIIENIGVFRDSGVLYVEAEMTAAALGVNYEYYSVGEENGMYFHDGSSITTLGDMLRSYTEQTDENEDSTVVGEESEDSVRHIYVFCSTPEDDSEIYFPARGNLDYYGVGYTYLVDDTVSDDALISLAADGGYCLKMPEIGEKSSVEDEADVVSAFLDSVNTRLKRLSLKKTRYLVADCDEEMTALLCERGYIVLRPDFTVNGASYPDAMIKEIENALDSVGYASVYLEDCWNSERMAILLAELIENDETIKTINIYG